ncbi:MAG: hypothetical protein OXM55_01695 [Bdellovibrionales bacterium]|nr:hypothetical protein [Bdellovibrionales bacterium]
MTNPIDFQIPFNDKTFKVLKKTSPGSHFCGMGRQSSDFPFAKPGSHFHGHDKAHGNDDSVSGKDRANGNDDKVSEKDIKTKKNRLKMKIFYLKNNNKNNKLKFYTKVLSTPSPIF